MSVRSYTRVCNLGSLPQLVTDAAGPNAVDRIFRDQDVPTAILDRPDTPLLHHDRLGLYRRAADITGERSFGLRVGAGLRIRDMGLFGQYVATAPSLEHALIRSRDTIRFHETCSSIDFERAGGDIRFFYRCCEQGNVGWRQQADAVVCGLVDIVRCILGPKWVPGRIEVTYQGGRGTSDLEDHFGVPVHFARPDVGILFNQALLGAAQIDRPCLINPVTRADVERHGRTLPPDFVGMAAEVVRQRLLVGSTDLEGAAAKLGIGPRTFQRRLSDAGLSYNRVLSECMWKRAADLLAERSPRVTDIASALGYSSQTQFTRAFKRWAGMPPGKFRKLIQADRTRVTGGGRQNGTT